MATKKPVKKAVPKKVVRKRSGGEIGEADAVAMFRNTALNSLKQGRAISAEERYYVENPNSNMRFPEEIKQYYATKAQRVQRIEDAKKKKRAGK